MNGRLWREAVIQRDRRAQIAEGPKGAKGRHCAPARNEKRPLTGLFGVALISFNEAASKSIMLVP